MQDSSKKMKLGLEMIIFMLTIPVIAGWQTQGRLSQPKFVLATNQTNQTKSATENDTSGANVMTDSDNNATQSPGQPPHKPWSITKPGYDIRLPPWDPTTNAPVLVKINVYTDYIQMVNEHEGEMVVAMFFKASWKDSGMRQLSDILQGLPGYRRDMLPMAGELKEKVWVPDLYLPMARRVSVPTIHAPAESVTLLADGTVQYSAIFVIALKCQMQYGNYPMDVQSCYLDLMSYRYSVDEMRLRWQPDDALQGTKETVTRHFHITVGFPKDNRSFTHIIEDGGIRDVLRLQIVLKRHLTFHLLQTYLPSTMLVFVGWLSLLVPLDFAYGRMVLSVSTLLVLVSIFVTTSQMAPGVNQVKALDMWMFMCIFFVFSAIVHCIADLCFLSMVEKESQIAGEERADADVVVERRGGGVRQGSVHRSTVGGLGDASKSYVKFHGENTPFQSDKEVLIATPAVLRWLRMAVLLERSMIIIYPSLFVLCVSIYWSIFLVAYFDRNE